MIENTINSILSLCDSIPNRLSAIPTADFNVKPSERWSKKEIVGHLIDSATVNLQRFIRGQIENSPQIYYEQDDWVSVQAYQNYNDENLIRLWESLNRHIVHILSQIPDHHLKRTCMMKNGDIVTLHYLAEDYLFHLQHHIKQIFP